MMCNIMVIFKREIRSSRGKKDRADMSELIQADRSKQVIARAYQSELSTSEIGQVDRSIQS